MRLPETGITREFYKLVLISNQRSIFSNGGQPKVEKSIFSNVRVVLISTGLLK